MLILVFFQQMNIEIDIEIRLKCNFWYMSALKFEQTSCQLLESRPNCFSFFELVGLTAYSQLLLTASTMSQEFFILFKCRINFIWTSVGELKDFSILGNEKSVTKITCSSLLTSTVVDSGHYESLS